MTRAVDAGRRSLELLFLEDSEDDLFLVEHALRAAQVEFHATRCAARADFIAALEGMRPDAILADYHLPDLDGPGALEIARRIRPDTPFVVVTGGLSDDKAVGLLRAGADDYVLKDRLARLAPAVLAAVERVEAAIRHREDAARLREALLGAVGAVARTVELRDPWTAGHQRGVAALSGVIAARLGLAPERIEGLRLGALMHDIGKIRIPSEALNRPGELTRAEWRLVHAHPEKGYEVLRDIRFPWPVAEMILQHHERMDGTGYPQGLRGEAILLEARIIAVADAIDAMTAPRAYRPAMGLEEAMAQVRSLGAVAFDPAVVDACAGITEIARPDQAYMCSPPFTERLVPVM